MLGWPILDETDWSRCFHAYALATDTPEFLREMVSTDSAVVYQALDHLDFAVLHQGTVYPATAPTVRVLAGLLNEPHWRAEVDGATVLTRVLGFIGSAGESGTWVAPQTPCPIDQIDIDRFFELLATGDDSAWSYEGVAAELMRRGVVALDGAADEIVVALLPFVSDIDPATRRAALGAVASWAQLQGATNRRDEAIAAARSAVTRPGRDERATAVLALGDLSADTTPWLDDFDPAIRACAALALPDDPRATDELIGALTDPHGVDLWFEDPPARFWGRVRFTLIDSLVSRGLPFERILPAAVAVAAVAHAMTANSDWGPLLQAAFPAVEFTPGVRPAPPAHLSDAQRTFLRALVANDSLWDERNGNANLARMRVGLPKSRSEVAALAE